MSQIFFVFGSVDKAQCFSSSIVTSPPQERPTDNASSSSTPKLSRRDSPRSSASRASSITAPSIQPPLTEPTTFGSESLSIPFPMSIPAPLFRGAERHVRITRANTKGFPESTQFSCSAQISLIFTLLKSKLMRENQ